LSDKNRVSSPKGLKRLQRKAEIMSDELFEQEEYKKSLKIKRLTSKNREDLSDKQVESKAISQPTKAKMFQKASMFI